MGAHHGAVRGRKSKKKRNRLQITSDSGVLNKGHDPEGLHTAWFFDTNCWGVAVFPPLISRLCYRKVAPLGRVSAFSAAASCALLAGRAWHKLCGAFGGAL